MMHDTHMNIYEKKLNSYMKMNNEYKIKKYLSKMNLQMLGGARSKTNNSISVDKENILKFILNNYNEKTYAYMEEINNNHEFKDYGEFVKNNNVHVEKLENNDIKFIKTLIDKFKNEDIAQCDEEDYVELISSSLYFNKDGQLVIVHRR